MDLSPPTEPDFVPSQQPKADNLASRKRKVAQKKVVTVKIETNNIGKQKGEGPPSDFWSWRKYGQKPIKGSPYPRGYYRCSTSKGCTAKKQVERCRTDPSVIIITYTADHNHPDPDPSNTSPPTAAAPHSSPTGEREGVPTTDSTKQPTKDAVPACHGGTGAGEGDSEPQSPPECSPEGDAPDDPETIQTDKTHCPLSTTTTNTATPFHDKGEGLPYTDTKNHPTESSKQAEDNFFDELEELPVSSSFTGWVRSSSFDDRVLLPLPIPLLDY